MGFSYQDIETRLRVVEDKIDFTMRTFAVSSTFEHPLVPGQRITETKTLLDVYRQAKGLGMSIEDVTEPDPKEIEDPVSEPANG